MGHLNNNTIIERQTLLNTILLELNKALYTSEIPSKLIHFLCRKCVHVSNNWVMLTCHFPFRLPDKITPRVSAGIPRQHGNNEMSTRWPPEVDLTNR